MELELLPQENFDLREVEFEELPQGNFDLGEVEFVELAQGPAAVQVQNFGLGEEK